jgi:metallophosphoesterase superfamily enzyme
MVRTGSIYPSPEEDEFFRELAFSSQHRGLVMMPDGPAGIVNILDPFPALRELARSPIEPPAVVFWTSLGGGCALALEKARVFYRNVLQDVLSLGVGALDAALRQQADEIKTKQLLHISDLHFGDERSDASRRYIKGHLDLLLKDIDRVVVTGDLFNNAEAKFRDQYLDFKSDVERVTDKKLIVIPGNHDVRPRGNRLPGMLRQTYEFVVDIGWQPLVVDDDLDCVFFCFNSMEESYFARGSVTDDQLRRMAESLNDELGQRRRRGGKDLDRFTRIALVHHHPYAYETASFAGYDRFLRRVTGDEDTFTRFEEADRFVSWCAERGVSLILHGHKHVPHHVQATISIGEHEHAMLVVGCGSTTGAEGSPLCYDVVALNPENGRWAVAFYEDASHAGAGFRIREVTIDTRKGKSVW